MSDDIDECLEIVGTNPAEVTGPVLRLRLCPRPKFLLVRP